MSQPAPNPHHISKLLQPALDGIVTALADRPGQTDAEYEAKANDAWTLILSFQPRDAIDLMLTGQVIAFNALFADGARDVLRGMVDTMKQRAQSSLVAMGRLTQGHVDRLEKRGIQPHRTEAAQQPEKRDTPAARAPSAEPPQRPRAAASPEAAPRQAVSDARPPAAPDAHPPAAYPLAASDTHPPAASDTHPPAASDAHPSAAPEPTSPAAAPLVSETSWLDEPYQEWLLETPADLAALGEPVPPAASAAPAKAADRNDDMAAVWSPEPPNSALPYRPRRNATDATMAAAGD